MQTWMPTASRPWTYGLTMAEVAQVPGRPRLILIEAMKKIDNNMIEVDGRVYMYDHDSDVYFRIHDPITETFRERMIKIAVALGLLVIIVVLSKYYF